MPRLGRFTSGKETLPIIQEAKWAPGSVWTGAEVRVSAEIKIWLSVFICLYRKIKTANYKLLLKRIRFIMFKTVKPYPTAFPYGNGMVLHFYQQQESSTTKTVHKVINKGLKAYV